MRFNLLKTSLSSDSVLCVSVESLSLKKVQDSLNCCPAYVTVTLIIYELERQKGL